MRLGTGHLEVHGEQYLQVVVQDLSPKFLSEFRQRHGLRTLPRIRTQTWRESDVHCFAYITERRPALSQAQATLPRWPEGGMLS